MCGLGPVRVAEVRRILRLVEVRGEEHDPALEVVADADEPRADVPPPALQVLEGAPMPCTSYEASGLVRHWAVPVPHVGAHRRDVGHKYPVAVCLQLCPRPCILQVVAATNLVHPRALDEWCFAQYFLHHASELCTLPSVFRSIAISHNFLLADNPPAISRIKLYHEDGVGIGATPGQVDLAIVVLEEEWVPVLLQFGHRVPDALEWVVCGKERFAKGCRKEHPVAHDHGGGGVVRQRQALRFHQRPVGEVPRVEVATRLGDKEEVGVLVDNHRRIGSLAVLGLVGLEVVGEVQGVAEARPGPRERVRQRGLGDAPGAATPAREDREQGGAGEVGLRDPVAQERDNHNGNDALNLLPCPAHQRHRGVNGVV
mmetsp:Transcript_67540/g.197626  ORF Transcript_67540/g.197626 Transcript_67540/m.197626 type:complete len:371 (+) Transcript_67540:1038-2150(+)